MENVKGSIARASTWRRVIQEMWMRAQYLGFITLVDMTRCWTAQNRSHGPGVSKIAGARATSSGGRILIGASNHDQSHAHHRT